MEQKWNNTRTYKKIKPTNQENPTKEKGSVMQNSVSNNYRRSLKLRLTKTWYLTNGSYFTGIALQFSTVSFMFCSLNSRISFQHHEDRCPVFYSNLIVPSCNFTHIKLYAMYELYYICLRPGWYSLWSMGISAENF